MADPIAEIPTETDELNLGAVLELMDFLEQLAPTAEADIEFDEPFDLHIIDDDGNEATITLLITADNYIPISSITFALAVAIKVRFGVYVLPGLESRLTTLSTRIGGLASTKLAQRYAGSAFGVWLAKWAPRIAKVGGWILVIDLLIFGITAFIRASGDSSEIDYKPDRQAIIDAFIMGDDVLWSWYNYDPTPAATYGLDFPLGVMDVLIRPFIYDYIEGIDVSELFAEDMIESLIQSSLFVMIGTWMGLGLEIIEISIQIEEADYFYGQNSDLSQFIGDYIQKQEQQLYQTIMNTLIMDPYLLLELFLGAIALKTFYQVYTPHLVSAFQIENR
mgnify:FL=1